MRLLWEYPLPQSEQPRDYEYEGPLLVHGDQIYLGTYSEPEVQARPHSGLFGARLHRIDRKQGIGEWCDFGVRDPRPPGAWSLTPVGDEVLFHCGAFVRCLAEPRRLAEVPDGDLVPIKLAARPEPLRIGTRLYCANDRNQTLCCLDLAEEQVVWSQPLKGSPSYRIGAPLRFGERIACYGRDALLIFDSETGETLDELKVPRVDKLYSPLADGDDLLIGYTNYSSAGVLRYRPATGKVGWQYRKKFEGPASYCRIWRVDDLVVWVKGETELIAVDTASGTERWRAATHPYLYSRITVLGTDLLLGTAGRQGAVQVVNGLTGETRWRLPLHNGCSYYALHDSSVLVGDFDGWVRRLDLRTGTELDRLQLGTEIVGDIAMDGERVYTVAWPDEERPARLVCIDLGR